MASYTYAEMEHLEDGRAQQAVASGRRPVRRIAAAVVAALGLSGVAAVASAHAGERAAQRARVEAAQEKIGVGMMAEILATGLTSGAKLVEDGKTLLPEVQDVYAKLKNPSLEIQAEALKSKRKVNLTEMANLTADDLLKPKNQDRHDGNICADDEEAHLGMCYKKCSALTDGNFPIRTTAYACCMERPCSFFNSKFTNPLIPCHGFAVAGKEEGEGCPHTPGDCMLNEEFSLGVCYKKCAILTENKFPYRSGAATCCRYNSHLACLDALNVNTSAAFAVGGGLGQLGDGTPEEPHAPMKHLVES